MRGDASGATARRQCRPWKKAFVNSVRLALRSLDRRVQLVQELPARHRRLARFFTS